ncbi:MAG: A/G-specific adenine glycosylase [Clostridia bacterium]|nr:A/G-specific adenine glycosylase [Clostridia bacterium]
MKEKTNELPESLLRQAIPPLLSWFSAHRADLPWRREPTPYHVWLSEIMLQQTRIRAALPYYERFLSELPTVAALAAVPEERLLKLWEGLGYYSRARNLKKTAILLCERYGGELPRSAAELASLPGVGPYTAGAIASIAYGEPEPAVDGNVLRVLSRLTLSEADVLSPATRTAMTNVLCKVYPAGREAGALTEALMELGETVCLPNGAPLCENCPLAALCLARRAGRAEELPVRSQKKERRVEKRTVLLLSDGDGEKLAVCRRPSRGLLAGMWEFPNFPGAATKKNAEAFLAERGGAASHFSLSLKKTHIFTHIEWQMTALTGKIDVLPPSFVLADREELIRDYALPTAFRQFL